MADMGEVKAQLVLNIKKFLSSIKDATSGVDEMADDISDALDDIQEQADSSFEGMRGSATIFGTALATAGATVGVALLDMTNNFKDTEKSLRSFGAQTGTTGEELEGFQDAIESTYLKGYGEDIQEVSDTYSKFQRELKLSADETETLTEKAFQLRDIFGYEVEDSLRAVTSSMTQFGISGEDAYDLITVTAQKAGDRADDLLDTVDEYSKDFAKAGYSAEEMFNLLIAGIDSGVRNFDVIGDTVKEFGNVLLQSGEEGVEILTQLTGSEQEANKMMNDLADGTLSTKDAMSQVIDGLASMESEVERNQIGASLFGSLWEEAGLKGLQAMTGASDAVGDYSGTLESANSTLEGTGKTMEQVNREFEQATNLIGQELAPVLSKALEFASKLITKLLEFAKTNPLITSAIALGGLLISILGTLAGAIIAIGAYIAPITAGIEFLGSVIAGIGAIVSAVGATIISVPALIIAAIIALIVLIIVKWEEIKAFTIAVWNAIFEFIKSVPERLQLLWTNFLTWLSTFWENLKTNAINAWNATLEFIKSIPGKLLTFFTTQLPYFIGYVIGRMIYLGQKLNEIIIEFFTVKIPQMVRSGWNTVINIFTKVIPSLISKMGSFVVNVGKKLANMVTVGGQKAQAFFNKVGEWFSKLPQKVASFGTKLYEKTKYLGKRMIDGLGNFVKDLPKTIKDACLNALNGVGELGSQAYSKLKSFGSSMWSGFKSGLGISSPSYIEEAMFDIEDETANMSKKMFTAFRNLKRYPQIRGLSELTKAQQKENFANSNVDNKTIQTFNAPLVTFASGDSTSAQQTAYSLYDLITFNKRAMGVQS